MNAIVLCSNCVERRIEAKITSDVFNSGFKSFVEKYPNLTDEYMGHNIKSSNNEIYRFFEGCNECCKSIINNFLFAEHSFSYIPYKNQIE